MLFGNSSITLTYKYSTVGRGEMRITLRAKPFKTQPSVNIFLDRDLAHLPNLIVLGALHKVGQDHGPALQNVPGGIQAL